MQIRSEKHVVVMGFMHCNEVMSFSLFKMACYLCGLNMRPLLLLESERFSSTYEQFDGFIHGPVML